MALFVAFEAFDGGPVFEAGHLGHAVDDEDTFEVVELVLPATGQEAGGGFGETLSVEAGGGDGDDFGAKDIAGDFGEAQAAFFGPLELSLGVGNHRIDVELLENRISIRIKHHMLSK